MPKRKMIKNGGRVIKTRSQLEADIVVDLQQRGISFVYEPGQIPFPILTNYTPDIVIPPPPMAGGRYIMEHVYANPQKYLIIEIKGRLDKASITRYLALKKQYPDLDLRFVLQKPDKPLTRVRTKSGSRRNPWTHAQWCERNGFIWSTEILDEWLKEKGL